MTETTKKTTRTTGTAKKAGTAAPKKSPAAKKPAARTGAAGPVKRARSGSASGSASVVKAPKRKAAPRARTEDRPVAPRKVSTNQLPEQLQDVLKALSDKKVVDLTLLDVEGIVSYADYFVIGTGNNTPHVHAMADAVAKLLKVPGVKGARVEGDSQATWVLIDGGNFVVHLFQPDARRFYALDDLWGDAARVSVDA